MGTLKHGLHGGVTGRVGNLVSYHLKGQTVIRTRPHLSKRKPSTAQADNRSKMALLTEFFRDLDLVLRNGFDHLTRGTRWNYHNLAVMHNKSTAITGFYPDNAIDYSKILLSKGDLPQPAEANVSRVTEGLKFTWVCPAHTDWMERQDQVMLMACIPGTTHKFCLHNGAKRSAEQDFLFIPKSLRQQPLETYIAFVADDRLQAADSLYMGQIPAVV